MKARRAIRLSLAAALSLLLGAATTVGVAWGASVWAGPARPRLLVPTEAWPLPVPAGWPAPEQGYTEEVGFARTELFAGSRSVPSRYVRAYQFGWPCRSLVSAAWPDDDSTGGEGWRFQSIHGGLISKGGRDRIPLMPLWPGFAGDTALYAAAWHLLLFTPLPLYRTARHRFRVSRGMCGSCGYDLKGSPTGPCPECGHALGAKP